MPYLGKSPSQGVRTRFQFTPNAGTTSISGADANGLTLSFTDGNYVDVYLNGVMLKAGVDYNTNTANTIAGLSATVASDVVDIVVYDTFSLFGGTLEGNVKVNNGTFNVTGAVDFDSTLNVDGVVTTDGATHDGDVTFTGANYNVVWDKSDNALEFGDNAKAVFGAGSDLIIQHDGSRSIIQDNGTGNLRIQANNLELKNADNSHDYVFCSNGGAVELYHNNSKKIETTSFGVTVSGYAYITENSGTTQLYLRSNYNSTGPAIQGATNHPLLFLTNNSEKMRIDSSGRVGIGVTPTYKFEVSGTGDIVQYIANTNPSGTQGRTLVIRDDHASSSQDSKISYAATSSPGQDVYFGKRTTSNAGFFHLTNSSGAEHLTVEMSTGNVGIGTSSPADKLEIQGGGADGIRLSVSGQSYYHKIRSNGDGLLLSADDSDAGGSGADIRFHVAGSEHMRLDHDGFLYVGKTAGSNTVGGATITPDGQVAVVIDGTGSAQQCIFLNREASDGTLILFRQANGNEGSISVSGSTVSYNGFSGLHESSGIPTDTPIGTVVSTIDELDIYFAKQGDSEEDNPKAGQTRKDHAKVKVSDTVGDKAVYGVVGSFNEQGKVNVASVGIGSVRVTGTCVRGDLLESNGDGTAKVQSDDIIRSKTIGKVTIGNSNTGVKLVSCVLYCG